jgi:hypothetical protein
MLWSASTFNNYTIAAIDGRLGAVKDCLFEDFNWSIRWLVVDTGGWLSDRKVLLPTSALGRIDANAHEISTQLTTQRVKDSPPSNTDWPESRQMDADIYDYYRWVPHWGNSALTSPDGYVDGALAAPPLAGLRLHRGDPAVPHGSNDDPTPKAPALDRTPRFLALFRVAGGALGFREPRWRIAAIPFRS